MENPLYNYLDNLNQQQREAVTYLDGPQLVIAGAGSGKTRVLTYKIAHLILHGYEPWRILALTFTNKAAREMKDRISRLLDPSRSEKIWMGTFHSIFLRILRRHADLLGFKPGFTIYDTSDSRSLLKIIVKELGLDDKIYKPSVMANVISNAKNRLQLPEQYSSDKKMRDLDNKSRRPHTGQIYAMYCERCKRANAMDFDDILVHMNILLRDFPDIRQHYREFFKYILVDEYQDTNFSQHLIINQLTDGNHKFCVVGDDAQSIYSFRGANISNILNLHNQYPDLQIFRLERNYRSTQNIVNASRSLIDKNTEQMQKNVYSENEPGSKIEVIKTYSDMDEAFIIANNITNTKLTFHDSYEDYAVLYRTNAQSRVLEESLRKRNIPYRIYGGLSFYQRKEIKDVICYFRLTVNPDDDEALKRVINYPMRGIGETTLKKLQACAEEHGSSLWSVIRTPEEKGLNVTSGTLKKLTAFREMILEFIAENNAGTNAYDLGRTIYNRTGILVSLAHDKTPESISRQENLTEMLSALQEFVRIKEKNLDDNNGMTYFLSEVMLATDQDSSDDVEGPKVTLMTAHAAKGLEFNHIYVVGVEEELFPSAKSMDKISGIEEERRLLYVAITRAGKTCTLTYTQNRFRNGQTVNTRPSRFLHDISPKYLDTKSSGSLSPTYDFPSYPSDDGTAHKNPGRSYGDIARPANRSVTRPSGLNGNNESDGFRRIAREDLQKGTRVLHKSLGEGVVEDFGELSGEPTVSIKFSTQGVKKLLLRFAILKILE